MLVPARSDAAVAARTSRAVRVASVSTETWLLGGLVVLGAVLRFATLGAQSYWFDEAQAAHELQLSLGSMLSFMVSVETAPPLYFVLGWVWVHIFGAGEVALRSLSALAGTALIPLAYLCGREFVSRRAGLLAAAFVAVNPFMVWYSQEAREYMLVAAFCGASLLFFARAWRDPSGRNIAGWGVFSVLALLTHYFAGFLIAPEALWLLYVARNRAAVIAVAVIGARRAGADPAARRPRHHLAARLHHRYAPEHAAAGGAGGLRARAIIRDLAAELRADRRGRSWPRSSSCCCSWEPSPTSCAASASSRCSRARSCCCRSAWPCSAPTTT